MLMGLPLLFALLVGLTVLIGFAALWRLITDEDPVEARLKELGVTAELTTGKASGATTNYRPAVARMLNSFGLGPVLANALTQADISLTVAEFTLINLMLVAGLVALGWWRGGPVLGLLLGAMAALLILAYVRMRQGRRKRAFTDQLPNMLTLLVGALRAGFGLTQALDTIRPQLPAPTSVELGRAMRAVKLGLPVARALDEMADRAGSDDLALVVTAINVQRELGGNLAQTLDIISETVRDRIRIKREIDVFTSQQRLTGIILALLPIGLGIVLYIMNPEYMKHLFDPGITRIMLVAAVVMEIAGFLVIRKMLDIEV
jgi:tight adherence protein B